MAQIQTLKDYDNNIIYPQSITKAIVNTDGINLDTIHQSFISSAAIERVEELNIEHESTLNKVLSINNYSTDVQYPSAKAVYDLVLANKDVGINMEVVDSLPTENIDSKTIYLVKTNAENTYEMYVYANGEWRQVGNTEVDLSNYATKDELNLKADKTSIPTSVSQLTNDKNFATVSQIPDVSNFATVSQIPNVSNFVTRDELNSSAAIPTGLICMWSGTTVPTGWALCNGTNGTPDLRDRFIVGSGNSYATGTTGGSNTVTLTTAQMPSHSHSITLAAGKYGHAYGKQDVIYEKAITEGEYWNYESFKPSTNATGSGSAHENRPPYYALAFIMKL